MVRTHGLSHLALIVPDPERSAAFYTDVFGAEVYFRDADSVQLKGPGAWDVLAFERGEAETDGRRHFGFRLVAVTDVDAAVAAIVAAGGTLVERGEFAPGFPYLFARDLDGYLLEVWYE